ncbi:lamin tail domain-containing protein [Polyangium aurulentum]|uniref:lamin tail domain-containing protein n=1 Tax=Polyangium aurulentum TaxID=2567896 RepID=UPI0010ADF6DE|nr:lamin tail domain-containing protein [Polyangium aurulentum]UQA55552.1 lamin tail domain-containing protein [Polyangium aurulentum]
MAQKTGKVFVCGDEWTTSDTGFTKAPAARAFVQNLASWFTGGRPGKFLVYSTNFGLTQNSFLSALKAAGHTVTTSISATFTAQALAEYDAVFLAGNAADNNVLIEYVKSGGNVYLCGGTGAGGSGAGEANQWKTFLNAIGLRFEPIWNGFDGNFVPPQDHPVLKGVAALYCSNGNPVSDIDPESPANQVVSGFGAGQGLLAFFDASLLPQRVAITSIFYDGLVKSVESDEFVEITNQGFSHVDISGWKLHADDARQDFAFPAGTILRSGQSIRVYTNESHPETGGHSFGIKRAIWNNKTDEGKLFDAAGTQVSSHRYTAPPV